MATARYPVRIQVGDGKPHDIGTWEITAHAEQGRVNVSTADVAGMLRQTANEIAPDPALTAAYRERARLVAHLASLFPAVLHYSDPDEPDWPVIYITTPAGQLSWHLARADLDLFEHVPWNPAAAPSPWDGHSTAEKYERLTALTRRR